MHIVILCSYDTVEYQPVYDLNSIRILLNISPAYKCLVFFRNVLKTLIDFNKFLNRLTKYANDYLIRTLLSIFHVQ